MNDSRIDMLFEEKLASLEVKPSTNAWDRIESGIKENDQSKSKYYWYGIAASIALFIVTAVLLTISDNQTDRLTGQNELPLNKKHVPVALNNDEAQTLEIAAQEINKMSETADQINTNALEKRKNSLAVLNLEIENIEMTEKPDLLNPVRSVQLSIQKQDFGIVMASIRFNPNLEMIPVSDEAIDLTNESGFKKAFQYAKRVKNGEESLFDLRKAKNDLFALAKNIKVNSQSKPN